jgi:proton glutamate symport protein
MTSKRTPSENSQAHRIILLAAAGVGVFTVGVAASLFFAQHAWPEILRWIGLVLLAVAGIQKRSLTYWIFFAMLAGAEIGFDHPPLGDHLRFLSDIFLRLIKVIVAPLIFGSLISGIAGHGDLRRLGRVGLKTFVYFELVTTLALFIGVGAIDLSRAGIGLQVAQVAATTPPTALALSWSDFLVEIFPENIAKAVAEGQILQVAVFAVLFGMALSLVSESGRAPLLNFCKSLTATMFFFTNIVMYFAPFGVGAAMAYTVSHMGAGALLPLAKLVVTAYAAILFFVVAVLLPIAVWAGLPIRRFVETVAEPVSLAFATSTSEAALPRAMEQMEFFGVPREIVSFVIPAGYSFNMDGSTLYLSLASIFVAQAAGIHMTWSAQLFMVFTLMLMSKGIAGVPRAVLVVLTATAAMFHLPTEPILIILGVDALIDMGRTALNVLGNCLASAVVARWEGKSWQDS